MLDLRSFLKQSSIYSISTFLSRAITLLLVPFYVRVLTPEDYGIVDILTIAGTLINLTIALEINQAVARFYNDWDNRYKPIYASTAFWFTMAIYSLFTLTLIPFKNSLASFFLEDNKRVDEIYAFCFMAWTSGIYYFTQSQLRIQMKATKHAITSIAFTIITTIVTIFLVLVLDLGVFGVITGLAVGNLAASTLAIFFSRETYVFDFEWDKLKEMLVFSMPLVLSSASIFLSLFIDRILIKQMLNLTQLGLFSIGLKFASVVGLFLAGINSALTPLIYSHYKEKNTPVQIEKIFRIFILLSMIVFLAISLNRKEILIIFTVKEYYAAASVIPILVLTTLMSSVYNFTPGLFIANKTRLISYINILVAAINLILNLLLIPIWGILGAGIASLTGYIVSFWIFYYCNQKYYPIKYHWNAYMTSCLFVLVVFYVTNSLPVTGLVPRLILNCTVTLISGFVIMCILFGIKMVFNKIRIIN